MDGEPSSLVITLIFFVISPDAKHDSHAVHHNRELLARYLKNIGCNIEDALLNIRVGIIWGMFLFHGQTLFFLND